MERENSSMYQRLVAKIGNTGIVAEDYGGYEITVTDNEKFPWEQVFSMLLDSGFQIWVGKKNSHIQLMSKPEVN